MADPGIHEAESLEVKQAAFLMKQQSEGFKRADLLMNQQELVDRAEKLMGKIEAESLEKHLQKQRNPSEGHPRNLDTPSVKSDQPEQNLSLGLEELSTTQQQTLEDNLNVNDESESFRSPAGFLALVGEIGQAKLYQQTLKDFPGEVPNISELDQGLNFVSEDDYTRLDLTRDQVDQAFNKGWNSVTKAT